MIWNICKYFTFLTVDLLFHSLLFTEQFLYSHEYEKYCGNTAKTFVRTQGGLSIWQPWLKTMSHKFFTPKTEMRRSGETKRKKSRRNINFHNGFLFGSTSRRWFAHGTRPSSCADHTRCLASLWPGFGLHVSSRFIWFSLLSF